MSVAAVISETIGTISYVSARAFIWSMAFDTVQKEPQTQKSKLWFIHYFCTSLIILSIAVFAISAAVTGEKIFRGATVRQ